MKIAVFTIVRNEKYFLPIWLKYYRRMLAEEDIYIIDNGTNDGSTDGLNIIYKPTEECFNTAWLLKTVKEFQVKLLEKYDWVLFSEADELIYHRGNNLIKYLETIEKKAIRCDGYEVVHRYKNGFADCIKETRDKEPEIDLNEPILKQRSIWCNSLNISKTLISRIPLNWSIGFHSCKTLYEIDKNVLLVHLHRMDFELALKRNTERIQLPIDKKSYNNRSGYQNWAGRKELEKYWRKIKKPIGKFQPIPEWIKEYE